MTFVRFIGLLLVIVYLLTFMPSRVYGQSLNLGEKVPHKDWTQMKVKPNKKLIVLDFWNSYCPSCMAAFPKLEKLQYKFNQEVEIILINNLESQEVVSSRLSAINKRHLANGVDTISYPTQLLSIFSDTLWSKYFPHTFVPHHVWLNQDGIVLAIASSDYTSEKSIANFLDSGVISHVKVKNDFELEGFDRLNDPIFQTGHVKLHPIFSSGLLSYQMGLGSGNSWSTDTINHLYRRTFRNFTPLVLYKLALSYLDSPFELINMLDQPRMFDRPLHEDQLEHWHRKHLYTYEITLSLDLKNELGVKMIQDLNGYFEYIYGIRAVFEKPNNFEAPNRLVLYTLKK